MKKSNPAALFVCLVCPTFAAPIPGHHLPAGMEQPVRERQVDIKRLTADLAIDMKRQTVAGSVTVMFTPLKEGLDTLILDAADIDIDEVEFLGLESQSKADFSTGDRKLQIAMPALIHPGADVAVRISYQARPDTGLYFFAESHSRTAEAWNYGEGGRHYNWLPLYNDTNDRFAV
ncbi:MAG: hypothetical protein ACE5OQ_13760, partial [Woeseia sp.]